MYEDKVLDLVSKTIPVYHRQPRIKTPTRAPAGHFDCEPGCANAPMSRGRRYITARVVDFERDEETQFQFLYSPSDVQFAEGRTELALRLYRGTHGQWTYYPGEDWNDQTLQIRGWWENGEFNHKSGPVRMGDMFDMTEVDDGDDMWWPEVGIQTFKPTFNGAYYDIPNVEHTILMSKADMLKTLAIHPSSSRSAIMPEAGWKLHGKKKKVKKRRLPDANDFAVEVLDAEVVRVEMQRAAERIRTTNQIRNDTRWRPVRNTA